LLWVRNVIIQKIRTRVLRSTCEKRRGSSFLLLPCLCLLHTYVPECERKISNCVRIHLRSYFFKTSYFPGFLLVCLVCLAKWYISMYTCTDTHNHRFQTLSFVLQCCWYILMYFVVWVRINNITWVYKKYIMYTHLHVCVSVTTSDRVPF
jgi:hypothetical protein